MEYLTVSGRSLAGTSGSRSLMMLLSCCQLELQSFQSSLEAEESTSRLSHGGGGALSVGLPNDMEVSFPWDKQSKREQK